MMSDEVRISTLPADLKVVRPLPEHGIDNHWCEQPDCSRWGSFGFDQRGGTIWFCGQHCGEGERWTV